MTQDIIEQQIKGISIKVLWTLVVCTALSVTTVLSVFYGFKTQVAILEMRVMLLEQRIERVEHK